MMVVKHKQENKKFTVYIEGRIDTNTAPTLLDYLKGIMPDANELVVDLRDVDYISSSGLRVFLAAQKTMNEQGSLTLTNVQDEVMEVFQLTGFTDFLTIV